MCKVKVVAVFGQRSFANENSNLLFSRITGSFLTKFCMLAFGFVEMKIYKYNAGHMTKMAGMPLYGKFPFIILFPGTRGTITWKVGMKHQGLHPMIVCSSYDPGLTLTYFW